MDIDKTVVLASLSNKVEKLRVKMFKADKKAQLYKAKAEVLAAKYRKCLCEIAIQKQAQHFVHGEDNA